MRTRTEMGGRRLLVVCALCAAVAVSGCSRSSEAKEARFLESGKKYVEQKDYARAILQFKNAARSRPTDPEPYYQLGLTYLAIGDLRSTVAHLAKAAELNPQHAGAQLKLAQLMTATRNPEVLVEAEKRAQAVLAAMPNSPDALSTLAVTELRMGKSEDAEDHLRQALSKFPQHLKSSMALAHLKLARRDFAGAEEVLKKAVEQAPQAAEPPVALGRLYVFLKKPAEAEAQFRRALEIDPKQGPALLDLAALQLQGGQKEQAEQSYKQVAALPQKEYKPAYAFFLYRDGRREAAIAEFEKLAKEDPKDRQARARLVAAYLASNRQAEAEKLLTAALKENPKDVEALWQRSGLYLLTKRPTEAEGDLVQVLRFRPEFAEAHLALSKVHATRGAKLNQRQELNEALRLNPSLLLARLELAQLLLASNSAKSALDLMDQTPETQKQTVPIIGQRNWALIAMGDMAEARKGVDRGLAAGESPDLRVQDGILKMREKDFAGARRSFEMALKQNPEELRALEGLARSYVAQGQSSIATQKLREHVALRPESARLQMFLGQWLQQAGDRVEARAAYTAAKAAEPGQIGADLALAQMDLSEGKVDAARQTLTAVLAAHPKNIGGRLLLAMLEDNVGNYPASVEHYRKVIEAEPNHVIALNNLAYRLATEDALIDEALKLAQQAKELAPDSPAIDDTIGWVFYRKGIYRTAVTHLESAVAKGKDPAAKYHLAMAYLKSGDRERGKQALDAALKFNPNLAEARAAQQVLDETR